MPWRGPDYDGEFPSLGWLVLGWAESTFKVPDGPLGGEPLGLTDEQAAILVRFYGLDDRGRWLFRRAAVRRAQGWGKSPLLAVIALAELCGPSKFDGWDASGDPVGVRTPAPWVQVAAVSEDQTDNTYSALYTMAQESDLCGQLLDVGLTRIFLNGEPGRLEPVTAAAGSRLGQRVTFAVLDETHLWTQRNGGHKLASTIRRNAGKMGGRTFESTNAHLPGEDSVAERTFKASEVGAPGLLYDSVEAPPVEDLNDRPAVLAALKVAYGDSAWVPLERLADEAADPAHDPDDIHRFYFNHLVPGGGRYVDILQWEKLTTDAELQDGEHVGLGFDGSISDDTTALYACTADLRVYELAVWERPPQAPPDWKVPRLEVKAFLRETFARFRVGRMFPDPAKWWSEIEEWEQEYTDDVVVRLATNSAAAFAPACDRFATAVREGTIHHDGKPRLTAHLAASAKKYVRVNADTEDGRSPFVIVKADARKIDCAVGATLAVHAAATMPVLVDVAPFAAWG